MERSRADLKPLLSVLILVVRSSDKKREREREREGSKRREEFRKVKSKKKEQMVLKTNCRLIPQKQKQKGVMKSMNGEEKFTKEPKAMKVDGKGWRRGR